MGLSGEPKSLPQYHPIALIQEDIHSRPRIPESLNSAFREMGQSSFFDSCWSSLSLTQEPCELTHSPTLAQSIAQSTDTL